MGSSFLVPPKVRWMTLNVIRKAAALGVPLHPPAHHPWNPLLSLRVSSLPMPEETRRRLIDGLFRAAWVSGLHISEPEVVTRIAAEAGLDGKAAVEDAGRPDGKERLRRQTDAAIAEAVFGVPTMIVDGELFWGTISLADRFSGAIPPAGNAAVGGLVRPRRAPRRNGARRDRTRAPTRGPSSYSAVTCCLRPRCSSRPPVARPRLADPGAHPSAIYFGRCLAGLASCWAFRVPAASTPALRPLLRHDDRFGVMVAVHAWGAIRRIQPLSETIEIAFWGALLVLALLFHPGG
jgi:hypothetical protein